MRDRASSGRTSSAEHRTSNAEGSTVEEPGEGGIRTLGTPGVALVEVYALE